MNKIVIKKDQIDVSSMDGLKFEKIEPSFIPTFRLTITKDMTLALTYQADFDKLDIMIIIAPNTNVNMIEFHEQDKIKKQTHYFLKENAKLKVERFYHIEKLQERDVITLEEENASFSYLLKTICTKEQKFDVEVYHNASHTVSEVIHQGISILKGALTFNISGMVKSGIKDCVVNQNSKIITNYIQTCKIKPILFIEENEIEASHSAFLGTFDESYYFYLESRGIPRKKAEYLLMKGFLLSSLNLTSEMNEKIHEIIKNYWR